MGLDQCVQKIIALRKDFIPENNVYVFGRRGAELQHFDGSVAISEALTEVGLKHFHGDSVGGSKFRKFVATQMTWMDIPDSEREM